MASGDPREAGGPHCLVCNVSVLADGSDSRDIFQQSILAERLQPILQVALYEGSSHTRNLCLNCEIQVGIIEEYYKVLEKFRKNFSHTASYYGLELVPIPDAQKPTYQFVQPEQNQGQHNLPTYSQAHVQTQQAQAQPIQVQGQINQGHWEEILFCLEPQNAQGAPQVLNAVQNTIGTSVAALVHQHQQQQQQQQHQQQQQQPHSQQPQQPHPQQPPQSQTQQQIPQQQVQQQSPLQAQQQLQPPAQQQPGLLPPKERVARSGAVGKRCGVKKDGTEQRQHFCTVCDKAFLNGTHLKQHMRTHTGEKPFKCPECSAAFSMQCNLKRHLLLHTGERPYVCSLCPRRYKQLAHLKRHMRTHDGTKPFECQHCDKTFRFEHDFKEHMRLHTGEGPYRCPMCESTFLRQRSYREHLKVHSDERPHQCDMCTNTYKRRSELVIHKRRHTGERPFVCDVCAKSFVTSSKLAIHKVLHTDLRPYKCTMCLATFKQKNNLKAHEKRHVEKQSGAVSGEECGKGKKLDEKKGKKKKKKKKRKMKVEGESEAQQQDKEIGGGEALAELPPIREDVTADENKVPNAELNSAHVENEVNVTFKTDNNHHHVTQEVIILNEERATEEERLTEDDRLTQQEMLLARGEFLHNQDSIPQRIDLKQAEGYMKPMEMPAPTRVTEPIMVEQNLTESSSLTQERPVLADVSHSEGVEYQESRPPDRVITIHPLTQIDRLGGLATVSVNSQDPLVTSLLVPHIKQTEEMMAEAVVVPSHGSNVLMTEAGGSVSDNTNSQQQPHQE